MEFTGKITAIEPKQTGASSNGPWASQSFVIEETGQQYPQSFVFRVFGEDKIKQFCIHLGKVYKVSVDFKSREYNGRHFTNINAWNVQLLNEETSGTIEAQVNNDPLLLEGDNQNQNEEFPF
jgi:hypothetical protein